MMSALLQKVRAGELKPLIHARHPFEQASAALKMLSNRKVVGKCILVSERGLKEAQTASAELNSVQPCRI
jgi:hypothetical protein